MDALETLSLEIQSQNVKQPTQSHKSIKEAEGGDSSTPADAPARDAQRAPEDTCLGSVDASTAPGDEAVAQAVLFC